MRLFYSCMRRIRDLNANIESLKHLSHEELLARACSLERRNFQLENILAKVNNPDKLDKGRPFDHSKYKRRHIALQFAYLGWEYGGMALQVACSIPTIVQKLLESMEKCRLIEDKASCTFAVAGRTDKNVSGLRQVLSIVARSALSVGVGIIDDNNTCESQVTNTESKELDYVVMLNHVLPRDIRILAWSPVPQDFSARFSCIQRSYVYYFPRGDLNLQLMSDAASRLEGIHDFRNFCSLRAEDDVNKLIRHVHRISVGPIDPNQTLTPRSMCSISVHGSGFLYHQIRYMVSILALIGSGLEPVTLIDDLLAVEKIPARPQYLMAADVPLLFFDAQYPEGVLQWETSEVAQSELIRHFQRLWSEQTIRSLQVKTLLDHVEERFRPCSFPMDYLADLIPEVRRSGDIKDGKRKYRPVSSRPLSLCIEQRMLRSKRKREKPIEQSSVQNKDDECLFEKL